MKKHFTLILLTAVLLAAKSSNAQDIFVKILDASGTLIAGASTDARHPNEIKASSFGQENTGCAISSGGGSGGACGGTAGHFIFNAILDQSYPLLTKALFGGTRLKSVDIVFRKTTGAAEQEYYKIHLELVLVSHITEDGNASNFSTTSNIQMQVELAAEKMGWSYYPQKPDGSLGAPVKFGWNAATKAPWSF